MRETTRYECKNCKYTFIAPTAIKCPKCGSHDIYKLENYIEKAPLQ